AKIPLDDRGHQFGNDNLRAEREEIERGAQSETHTEAANEHHGFLQLPRLLARELGQRLLRAVHAARHEDLVVGENDVFVVAADQLQDGAVWTQCSAKQFERLHMCDVTAWESKKWTVGWWGAAGYGESRVTWGERFEAQAKEFCVQYNS